MQNILKTPVDDIVDYLKKTKKCKIDELVIKYKIPLTYIERWLIILEEKGVLKVYYKGLEGFVEYVEDKNIKKEDEVDVDNLKQVFLSKAKGKGYTPEEIEEAWKKFISQYKEEIKQLFYRKAQEKGYPPQKIERGWLMYLRELERL